MKIKSFLTCLIVLTIAGNACLAQEAAQEKNEIRLGYGALTGPEMANSLISLWPAIGISIFKDTLKDYQCSFYGAADFEYNRFLKKWVSVGISLSLNPISTLITTKSDLKLTWNYYLINVMPKVTFYYINKGILSMYSGVEIGAAMILWKDRQGNTTLYDNGFSAAFHVNAFGIRVGKQLGAYMEWGYGFRGVVNIGISGKF